MPHPRFDAQRCLRETLAALSGRPFGGGRRAARATRGDARVQGAPIKAGDALAPAEMRALCRGARSRPSCRRTTCTGAARSCSSPGMSSSGDLAGAEPLRIICGPTAVGKSRARAGARASARGSTIVSADSRQVYRGFDIGTAKPTRGSARACRTAASTWSSPGERYSAARWARVRARAGSPRRRAGAMPVVVGGTGLYLRALDRAAVRRAAARRRSAARRSRPSSRGSRREELRRWVRRARSRARAASGGTQLRRAIEVALLTGRAARRVARASRARRAGVRAAVSCWWIPAPVLAAADRGRASRRCSPRDGCEEVRGARRGPCRPTRPAWTASATTACARARARASVARASGRATHTDRRPGSTPSGSAPGSGTSSTGAARDSRSTRRRPGRLASAIVERVAERRSDGVKIGITCYPTYGGSGAVATELGHRARRARPRGAFHHVPAALPPAGVPAERVLSRGRTSAGIRSSSTRRTISRSPCACTRWCSTKQLDLLHVHYAIPHATSAWIAREMLRKAGRDITVITTLHGTDITLVGQDHRSTRSRSSRSRSPTGSPPCRDFLRTRRARLRLRRVRRRRDPQLRRPRGLRPRGARAGAAPTQLGEEQQDHHAHLELPAR